MMKKTVKALSIAAIASAASVGAMADAQAGDGAYKVAAHHEGCDAEKGCNPCGGCNPCDASEGCNPCAAEEGCNPCGGGCNPCGGA